MIRHFKRWNVWRKQCLNNPIYKILVLFKLRYSPSFALDEAFVNFSSNFYRGLYEDDDI